MCLKLVFIKQIKSFEEEEVIDKITISPGGGEYFCPKLSIILRDDIFILK